MKISLISTENFIVAHGARQLSACLKAKGHAAQLIFLPLPHHEDLSEYEPAVLKQLIKLLRGTDLVGISSMAISSHRAKQVAEAVKQAKVAPVIWGGIYATTCPEKCLQAADMVCIGEGEDAILELAEKFSRQEDYLSTRNLWFKQDGRIVRNPLRPLKDNLDDLPFADYELDTQYILKGRRIIPARDHLDANPEQVHLGQILVHTARGCPYSCAYCSNRFLNHLYKGKGRIIRKRSFKNVIEEIVRLREKFPLAASVFITDDVFFLRDIDELKFFSREYRLRVNIPLQCYAAPPTIKEDKLQLALQAGLCRVIMGIQSGSERLNREIYKRYVTCETVLNAARILNQYKNEMEFPTYQFIVSNPYETADDLVETVRFLQKLPRPYSLEVSNLIFFPGCELFEKAVSEGLINNPQDAKYNIDYYDERRHLKLEKKNAYLNTLIYCMRGSVLPSIAGGMPDPLIDFFVRQKDSKWVFFYWLAILSFWRLRNAYLKVSAVMPVTFRRALSRQLKKGFISSSMAWRQKKENCCNQDRVC